jgi:SAM-dependent methyltransferase
MSERKEHWEELYSRKKYDTVTWFQPVPNESLRLIKDLNLPKDFKIIDVGAGASCLVDCLLDEGFSDITLVDLSENAFTQSKKRLGERAKQVKWKVADITQADFDERFDLWHDRAAFHFLTDEAHQQDYLSSLLEATKVGSCIVISTFAEDGPLKCSNLEIVRYAEEDLMKFFDKNFELIAFEKELHISPGGMEQKFNYWVFKRVY